MRFDILTLFPEMFEPVLNESILKKAREKGLIDVELHNLRDCAEDAHKTVDDTPYGGGTGMVLKVDVIDKALRNVISSVADCATSKEPPVEKSLEDLSTPSTSSGSRDDNKKPLVILLTPQGEKFNAKMAKELAAESNLILVCGHYEGFDERVREHLVDKQISIGDYVLTGGELPAMVLVDAISRFVPGVLPDGAPNEDSHSLEVDGEPALEYPHYTKPVEYKGWKVPDVLLSGNHAEIAKWRRNNLKSSYEG